MEKKRRFISPDRLNGQTGFGHLWNMFKTQNKDLSFWLETLGAAFRQYKITHFPCWHLSNSCISELYFIATARCVDSNGGFKEKETSISHEFLPSTEQTQNSLKTLVCPCDTNPLGFSCFSTNTTWNTLTGIMFYIIYNVYIQLL